MTSNHIANMVVLAGALVFGSPSYGQQETAPRTVDAPTVTVVRAAHAPNVIRLKVVPKGCRSEKCTRTVVSHNARTNAGALAIAQLIGQSPGLPFVYIALSTDTGAVAATDTVCPGEITGNGLARGLASTGTFTAPTTLGGSESYVLNESWTTSVAQTVTKVCAMNAASGGVLGFESLLSAAVVLNPGDSLSLQYQFSV
jgi:hypothetical protein